MTYSVDHFCVNTFDSTDIVPVAEQAGFVRAKYSTFGELPMCRLTITDEFSAETIDMHSLLDKVLKKNPQDPGVDISNIQKDVVYSIAH